MAVTKTDWSKPASDPVNQPASDEVYQDAIMRAAADMYMASPQVDPVSYDVAMAANQADRIANTLAAQASISSAQQKLANMAARDAQRQEIVRQQVAQENANRERGIRADMMRQSALAGFYPSQRDPSLPPLYPDTTGDMGVTSVAPDAAAFRAQEDLLSMGMSQRQAGFDAYQAMLSDAAAAARANIAGASEGLLGTPTRFMNERFLKGIGTRMGDRDSEAYNFFLSDPNLFSPVYNAEGRLTGYRDQYGRLTGTDPVADATAMGAGDDQPEVTPTVTNPATGREECPDGYIFDPDLNACRLDTRSGMTTAPTAPTAPVTPGEMYARTGLLDVAPEGLMGFRERYGAGFGTPSDFGAANLAFRQQAAISPEYFQTPPKLTGYTLL